jgi:parallel beta-helix repeat protein
MTKLLRTICAITCSLGYIAYGADVRNFGAVGDGVTDDTVSVQNAVNSCAQNGTVTFSPGNYLVRGISLRSQCTYSGVGGSVMTLSAPNQFIFDVSQQSNIRITGLVLDGNNRGGGVIAKLYGPAQNIQIDHNDFRNVSASAAFPANLAVVSTWGFINSSIQNNGFVNVSGGIWLTTVENVNVLNNSFTNVTQGDAIFVAPNAVSFQSGDNLVISGNTGTNLARMGIEIFKPNQGNGSVLTAPVISNNTFSNWTQPNAFALSITHGDGAIISGNHLINSNGQPQYAGIEIIIANAQVTSNVISGNFAYGVAVQGTAAPTITGNVITGMSNAGIILACDNADGRCASNNSVISSNTITNARLVGIMLDNDWSGSQITKNTMVRTAGFWPGDGGIWFSGISQSSAPGPGVIDSNTTIQDSPTIPTPGFWFCGVRVNTSMPGSSITNNLARSESMAPFGSGLIDNTGNATQGWIITGNTNVNTVHAVN